MANAPSDPSDVSSILDGHVRRFGDLLRFARRRHGLLSEDLDELEQEVRIRLWRAQGTGEKISAVSSSYMYRTAMSAAVDIIRRRRHEAREVPLDEATRVSDGRGTGGDESREVARGLEEALATLARPRAVAVRMHLAGYPREEIAALLGWSEAKTRNLVYRGLADLRDRLSEMGLRPGAGR